jgi:hypothetical protein
MDGDELGGVVAQQFITLMVTFEDSLIADVLRGIVLQSEPGTLFKGRFRCGQWDAFQPSLLLRST